MLKNYKKRSMYYMILSVFLLLILLGVYFAFFNYPRDSGKRKNTKDNRETNQYENINNNDVTKEAEEKHTKNYSSDAKIAYQNENDKENSTFIYLNDNNKNDYKWNDYILENKTILTTMPDIELSQFEELEDNFYTLKISDNKIYNEFAEKYNLKKLSESDFDNIFAQIIVMKDSDSLIKYDDVIKGEEFMSDSKVNYTLPVSKGGIVDTSEPFKYSCVIAYLPNYMMSNGYFNVIVQNEKIKVNKETALNIAKSYLKNLKYKGCTNFLDLNYIRVAKAYENNFLNIEDKENPKEDTNKKYTVWKVLSYSEEDPCTSAILYIDANTGKIIGGKINYATD